VGCSLGGALLYTMLAHSPQAPVGRLVAVASPLRWETRHPLVQLFSALGPLLGRVPVRGSRPAARVGLPVLGRLAPGLLSLYLTAEKLDFSAADELVRTVENPHAHINRQLAAWIRRRDLVVEGLNVREALARVENPLLLITASDDGIVPPRTAQSVLAAIGGVAEHLHVGGPGDPWSHVDLFVGRGARERVYRPVADWLAA
jgi:pimeloyl-ACP methyl ester carboxylesterase